jgi:thioredoxin-related protein
MKKILILLFICFSSLFSVEFVDNLNEGLEIAKNEDKKVILFYTQVGCPACEYMEDVVLENQDVQNYIDTYFVFVKQDIYKNGMERGFRAFGTPTMYFMDSEKNKISRKVVGGMSAVDFLEKLKSI